MRRRCAGGRDVQGEGFIAPFALRALCSLSALFLACAPPIATGADTTAIEAFENTVRPVLLKRCVECHGPRKAESGLRVDSREALLRGGDSGPAISPQALATSLLLKAVRHDGELKMPPAGRLPRHELAAIEQWIADGAPWPKISASSVASSVDNPAGPSLRSGPITEADREFWSLQPIADPPPPTLESVTSGNEIDRFVLRKLRESGLTPAPAADRRVWLRRATFDLTGLPPTPAELDAFLRDTSALARDKAINRLLQSPAYGERWGRHWLDVVRYADTAGETADYPTPLSYKYRNWVIDAFNADMPYDEFVRQQIAGDLLARELLDAGANQGANQRQYGDMLTATGFIAISRRFGFDVENYHHLTIQDTIDVIGQSMLGLTLGCARCHDHKYDPVNREDYYAWYGIFQSTRYSFPGSEEKKRPYDLVPGVPPVEMTARQQSFDRELAAVQRELEEVTGDLKSVGESLQQLAGAADFCGFEHGVDGQTPPQPYGSLGTARVAAAAQSPFANVFPRGERGLSFPSNTDNNAFGRTLAKSFSAEDTRLLYYNIDFRNTAVPDGARRCYRFYVGHGPGNSGAVELAANGAALLAKDGQQYLPVATIPQGVWHNLQVTLDLRAKTYAGVLTSAESTTRFEGKAFTAGWDGVIDYTFVDMYGPGDGATPGHEIDNLCLDTKPFLAAQQSMAEDSKGAAQHRQLVEQLRQRAALQSRADGLTKSRDALQAAGPLPPEQFVYGAVEQDKPVDAHIHLRGEITRLGDEVPRRNLQVLGGELVPAESGSGRLQLAEWITHENNPLFARVMVNRIWQHHFGRGLVGTENDFGRRGQIPTHPELLDWLASRFRESGYSVKAMHRLIMNSDAYGRSTEFNQHAAERDPDARLLWRFNRRRLSAEEIRDAMLAVADTLDTAQGGAHPFPPVSSWGFTQHNPYYGVYATNRRSVYLMQQRLKRHPFLGLFNGADTNVSTAHREHSTVPTQALFLMNSDFVHNQSEAFAHRLLRTANSAPQRVEHAYSLALGRAPTSDELNASLDFVAKYAAASGSDHAAWSALARTLLTRNEFLFVD
ncbi:MAG: PSD1 domain-containing protein [Planctomycetales bacterium]|nr:PSD1 domain-containing protein [Planctomycetales bacterium]